MPAGRMDARPRVRHQPRGLFHQHLRVHERCLITSFTHITVRRKRRNMPYSQETEVRSHHRLSARRATLAARAV